MDNLDMYLSMRIPTWHSQGSWTSIFIWGWECQEIHLELAKLLKLYALKFQNIISAVFIGENKSQMRNEIQGEKNETPPLSGKIIKIWGYH